MDILAYPENSLSNRVFPPDATKGELDGVRGASQKAANEVTKIFADYKNSGASSHGNNLCMNDAIPVVTVTDMGHFMQRLFNGADIGKKADNADDYSSEDSSDDEANE